MHVEAAAEGHLLPGDRGQDDRCVAEDERKDESQEDRVHERVVDGSRIQRAGAEDDPAGQGQPRVSGQQADPDEAAQARIRQVAARDVVTHEPQTQPEQRRPRQPPAGDFGHSFEEGRQQRSAQEQTDQEEKGDAAAGRRPSQTAQLQSFPGNREGREADPPEQEVRERSAGQPECVSPHPGCCTQRHRPGEVERLETEDGEGSGQQNEARGQEEHGGR